jgi:SWI/SNF-related matrix-associated actin-dependent regulator of chromatin subfamily A3
MRRYTNTNHSLNLTIASRIYLLEPQWNPFLEQQAIARAQRFGQTKQVVCIRYVMKGTIEQVRSFISSDTFMYSAADILGFKSDVLNRQRHKTALAGGGFKSQKMHDSLVSGEIESIDGNKCLVC